MKLDADRVPFLADNTAIEVTEFPETGWIAAVNNSRDAQSGSFVDASGTVRSLDLPGAGITWIPTDPTSVDVD
jgi:hypothetical protein